MTTMNTTSAKQRMAIGLMAILISLGGLNLFVHSFERGDADALAQRQMVLADKADRAREYRQLHEGKVRVATTTGILAIGAMAN